MTARWDQYDLTNLIRQILRGIPADRRYGTGRPFLSSYQIAIELAKRFPDVARALGHPTGGAGHGPFAISSLIARWLPERIEKGAKDIEFRFLSGKNITSLEFDDDSKPVIATTIRADRRVTMFRII